MGMLPPKLSKTPDNEQLSVFRDKTLVGVGVLRGVMNLLRGRLLLLTEQLPSLIEQLSDENLQEAWLVLQPLYYNLYMLIAMQESMRTVRPGDMLTREQALRFLQFP